MRTTLNRAAETADLLDLLARRPELRDVGIAGYLAAEVLGNVSPNPPAAWSSQLAWDRWEVWAA